MASLGIFRGSFKGGYAHFSLSRKDQLLQAKGSLAETNLRSLLEGAQSERATGTLTVRNGDQAYTLYFLFGHLFHATGEGATGDEAVLGALGQPEGDFAFDAKAKLPADETVKSTIAELVSSAGEVAAPSGPAPGNDAPAAEKAAPEPPAEPAHRAKSSEAADAAPAAEPPVRRGVKHRPAPRHGREPFPVPAGEVVYDSLKTSFVDFPRLITTLETEGYTGYVRLLTDGASGLILFKEGIAQEAIFDASEKVARGRDALMNFNEEVTHGHGVLDVVGLPAEIVDGLYDLVVAKPLYQELFASWVDMRALLEYLKGRQLTGSVMVSSEAATGIVILTSGRATGAYTSENRDISPDAQVVLDLCSDPQAMIEVRSTLEGAGRPPLDVDEIVGSRGRGRTAGPPPAPAPSPPPPAGQPDTSAFAPVEAPAAPTPASRPMPEPGIADTTSMPAFRAEDPLPTSTVSLPTLPPNAEAAAAPEPAPSAVASKPPPDWEAVITELQAMSDAALGARSRKVKDLLGSADRSQSGVEQAVAQVSQISLLFVDSALLVKLEQDMRARLQTYL